MGLLKATLKLSFNSEVNISLSKRQQSFTRAIGLLIQYATIKGYSLSFGDAYRDPRAFGEFGESKLYSSPTSLHKYRLAVDFNLFIDGIYITDGNHPAYKDLGQFWESLDQSASWGGNFNDANHFSFTYKGYK